MNGFRGDYLAQSAALLSTGLPRPGPDQQSRRERLVAEIQRLETQLRQLTRDAIEQGGCHEIGEQSELQRQQGIIEERLSLLRRELASPGRQGLTEQEGAAKE